MPWSLEKPESNKVTVCYICFVLQAPYHSVKDLSIPKFFFLWQIGPGSKILMAKPANLGWFNEI
jgi:hypothetical protein